MTDDALRRVVEEMRAKANEEWSAKYNPGVKRILDGFADDIESALEAMTDTPGDAGHGFTRMPTCPGIQAAPPALSGEERSVLGNLALPAMYEAGMPAEKREVIRSLLARTGKPLDRTKEAT